MKRIALLIITLSTAQAAEKSPSSPNSTTFSVSPVTKILEALLTSATLSLEELSVHEKSIADELGILRIAYQKAVKGNKARISDTIDTASLGQELIAFERTQRSVKGTREEINPSPRTVEKQERFASIKETLKQRLARRSAPESPLARPSSCPALAPASPMARQIYVKQKSENRFAIDSTTFIIE